VDTKKLKEALQQELDALARARDLAKAEARGELDRLESTWLRVQDEVRRLGDHGKEHVQGIETSARTLLDELKRGYERVKREIKM
jgi:hypothetical protein